jgi:hypothetical protein
MTDPRTLPKPFDRLVATLELAAAACGGQAAYDTTVRSRKHGDLVPFDAAFYFPRKGGDDLYVVHTVTGDEPVGVDAVDLVASAAAKVDAKGSAVVSPKGFTRPARKRADEHGVALVTLGERESEGMPGWLSQGGFELADLQWRLRAVSLPPVPGIPKNFLEQNYSVGDRLFANPQGRKFSPEELLRRWLKAPQNEEALRESLPPDGSKVERSVTLRFDRPMTLLANTVKQLPPLLWCDVTINAWMERRSIPMTLVEDLPEDLGLEGSPGCAYASAPLGTPEAPVQIWLWVETPPGVEPPVVRTEAFALELAGNEAAEEESAPDETAGA